MTNILTISRILLSVLLMCTHPLSCRLLRAKEMLAASEENLKMGQLRTSLNRSYYAVFHAMRAVNILEGFDSSKHSGVIAFFNKNILKENKMDRDLSGIIKSTSYLREKSDYDDFYIASKNEAGAFCY